MIYVIIFMVLALVTLHMYLYQGRVGRYLQKLQGPPARPLIGNLLDFNGSFDEMFATLRRFGDKYYPAYRLFLFHKAVICIRHPDDMEVVLGNTKVLAKDFGYEHIRSWLRRGLLTSEGNKWRERRKILTPAFHFNILKKYNEITNDHGEKAMEDVLSQGNETTVDLLAFITDYSLNVICDTAIGVSLDSDSGGKKYRDSVNRMSNIIMYRSMNPHIKNWMLPLFPKLKKETTEVLSNLDGFVYKIVKDRREYHKSTNNQHLMNLENDDNTVTGDVYLGKKKRLAMLDLLLAAEHKGLIDDAGIQEEVATFVFEGHDTTSMSLIFTIMLLAENKDAQDKARNEVTEIMNNKDGKLDMSDLNNMQYLERCIKESLRLFPSVPTIGRYMTGDLQFKNFFAPKGSNIAIHIVDTHRDPNFWPEPEKFDPDRFLPENMKDRHPYSYVPFSAGVRNCIGQKFAMMELKSLIARVLYNFYLEPVDNIKDVKPLLDLVMRPSKPVHAKFIKIHRNDKKQTLEEKEMKFMISNL